MNNVQNFDRYINIQSYRILWMDFTHVALTAWHIRLTPCRIKVKCICRVTRSAVTFNNDINPSKSNELEYTKYVLFNV
jgi:hypothetical protein